MWPASRLACYSPRVRLANKMINEDRQRPHFPGDSDLFRLARYGRRVAALGIGLHRGGTLLG